MILDLRTSFVAASGLVALTLVACGPDEELLPPPSSGELRWIGLYTDLDIPDFEGKYELYGRVTTGFDPLFAEFEADVFSEDGYSYVQEEAEVLSFALELVDGPYVNGRAVFRFKQRVKIPTFSCELEMEGLAQERHDPESEYWKESVPRYDYVGPIGLACLSDSVTMEAGEWYDEPGTLVGGANGKFVTELLVGPAQ